MKIFCKKILRRIGIEVIKKLRKVNYICQGTKDREREREDEERNQERRE